MCVVAQTEINRLNDMKLLGLLLSDKTSKGNIIWATDVYGEYGKDYQRDKEITVELLMREPFQLMSRAEKAREAQAVRTKAHAEVFTPLWVVKKMNDYLDADWFGYDGAFDDPSVPVAFPGKPWKKYVDSRRMEITCGEGPYLVSRYDVSTGEEVPLAARVGVLDRKLRVVSENTDDPDEWLKWAYRAFQSTYGYEFQGDNVLLARLNLLLTFRDYMQAKLGREPSVKEYRDLLRIITWNIWQMDGLSGTIPYCRAEEEFEQLSLFDWMTEAEQNGQPPCRIFDWRSNCSVEYRKLKEEKTA